MGKYDGKRVVITGGTSGIGLATAKFLRDEGARVLVTGRSLAGLAAARTELGDEATVVESDAASLPDIDKLAGRVSSEFGRIDLLFVNAGASRWAPLDQTTEDVYDELLTVNAKGPYFSIQRLAPLINDAGAVVLTTSVVNTMGYPMVSAYAASKAALRSMARTLAAELLPRGIRVNAVSPGPIDTPILTKSMSKEEADQTMSMMADQTPMKRLGHPEEIAKAVAFLGFEATYTTGAEFPVDGGSTQL